VYGKLSEDAAVFYWQHSYSRVFTPPDAGYSPTDGFMSFEHYNVEIRNRVKCISAVEGLYFLDAAMTGPFMRSALACHSLSICLLHSHFLVLFKAPSLTGLRLYL